MDDEKILSFKDLEPWQKGMELAERVHGATAAFPEEGEEIASRMRDASLTIPAAVSEAFALESTAQLVGVVAPIAELETCVELARRLGFLADDLADDLAARVDGVTLSIGRVIEEIDQDLDDGDDDYPGRSRPEIAVPTTRSSSPVQRLSTRSHAVKTTRNVLAPARRARRRSASTSAPPSAAEPLWVRAERGSSPGRSACGHGASYAARHQAAASWFWPRSLNSATICEKWLLCGGRSASRLSIRAS